MFARFARRGLAQITHQSAGQAVGKGREVAGRLATTAFSAGPASSAAKTSKKGVDGLTILLSLGLAVPFGSAIYLFFTEEGKARLAGSSFPLAQFLHENVVKKMQDSIADKLLPDLPEEHVPFTKTLVLDFEDTLVHLDWDQEFGWRGVKRPHVDQFLVRVASAGYEVVLFSSGISSFLEPMTMQVDPRGAIQYRLFREASVFVGNRHVKDLSKLNRDLAKVVAVDDDSLALEFQPENCLLVKPFTDKNDVQDNTLNDLALLLEDFQTRNVPDLRVELARLRQIGMGDALLGFKMERQQRVAKAEQQQHSGLGGMMRGIRQPPHAANTPATNAAATAKRSV